MAIGKLRSPIRLSKGTRLRARATYWAFYAEKAKIEVSAQPSSSIFADESQIGARDRTGREIYLDIPLERSQVETLVIDQIDRSIEICRKLIAASGYEASDIDRVVFIGGPTRMPIIRSRVPQQLGIMADLTSDPMTAVAFGAAIFSESRDSADRERPMPPRLRWRSNRLKVWRTTTKVDGGLV
jgi:molecular chaperone DnaK